MKSAHTITNEGMSATLAGGSILAGRLPKLTNTVVADVLARLLGGERVEGLDTVKSSSTTRLAAVAHHLTKKHDWFICREDKAQGCADGRVSTVAVYWLLQSTIADSNKKGAAVWCADVRAARLKLRAKAAEAKRNADAINAACKKRQDDRQADLFGGAQYG
jgi:hypothetical protein